MKKGLDRWEVYLAADEPDPRRHMGGARFLFHVEARSRKDAEAEAAAELSSRALQVDRSKILVEKLSH